MQYSLPYEGNKNQTGLKIFKPRKNGTTTYISMNVEVAELYSDPRVESVRNNHLGCPGCMCTCMLKFKMSCFQLLPEMLVVPEDLAVCNAILPDVNITIPQKCCCSN